MNDQEWHISRKNFIRTLVLGGVALQLPWLQSCANHEHFPMPADLQPLNKEQFLNLQHLLMTLFPDDSNGPSAIDVHADQYILWVLNDQELDPDENRYIIEKLDLFIQTHQELKQGKFQEQSDEEKYLFVAEIANEKWGKKWLSRLITLLFEALLLDPSYGGNPEESGWTWLEHNPGSPRPTANIQYPTILNLKNEI